MNALVFGRRYETVKLLGRGGSGEVFLALDRETGREVAIKKFLPEADLGREFAGEVEALSKISHERIVKLLDWGVVEDGAYLVSEYVRGDSLETYFSGSGSPPIESSAHIWVQLLGALDHLHSLGLIHRDLKPANVFLEPVAASPPGAFPPPRLLRAKLIDFGFVKNRASGEVDPRTFAGTLGYAAPEQIRSFELSDERSDLFSFGVILYVWLTGRFPYRDLSELFSDDPIPGPREFNKRVPGALDRLVLELVDRNPLRRPGSAADTAKRLEAIFYPEGIRFRVPSETGPAERGRPLAPERVADFLSRAAQPPVPPADSFFERFRRETGSLPGVVESCLGTLIEKNRLEFRWGETAVDESVPWPVCPEGEKLLADLKRAGGGTAFELLEVAACLPGGFTALEAIRLLARSKEEVEKELRSLAERRLLVREGDRWSSPLGFLRRSVAAQVPREKRRRYFRTIVSLRESELPPEKLAFYLQESGEEEKAARLFFDAAREKLEAGDPSGALGSLEAALSLPCELAGEDLVTAGDIFLAARRPGRALEFYLEYAENLRDPPPVEFLLKRGRAELRSRKFEGAWRTFSEAKRLAGDRGQSLRALYGLGTACRSLGRIEDARRAYERVLELTEEGENRTERVEALHQLGLLAKDSGRLKKAAEYLREALREAESLGDRPRGAVALNNLGNVLTALGEHEEAVACYHRSIDRRREMGDLRGLAITHNSLAQAHILRGDLSAALEAIEESRNLFLRARDAKGRAVAAANRGVFLGLAGRTEEAVRSLGRAIRTAERIKDPRLVLEVRLEEAEIRRIREPQRALETFSSVAETPSLPPAAAARAWRGIALCRLALGRTEEALESLAELRRHRESVEDPALRADLFGTEAEIRLAAGRIEEAVPLADRAWEELPPGASPFVRSRLARIAGEAWRERGPLWADRAERRLREARSTAAAIGYKYESGKALLAWAVYLSYTGEEEESFEEAREALTVFKELGAEREAREAAEFLKEARNGVNGQDGVA